MLYTKWTVKAMQMAYAAHAGQVDKCGVPYVFHPYAVAEYMEDEFSTCAALLHDVVEDTDIPMETIFREFPQEVAEAVECLTHLPGEDYYDYVERVKQNPIAVKVKLGDLRHNGNEQRLSMLGEEKAAYFREKYRKAKEILVK